MFRQKFCSIVLNYKVVIVLFCLLLVLGGNYKSSTITVNASSKSWLSGADKTIYGGETNETEQTEVEDVNPGTIEKLFIGLIKPIVDGLYDILKTLNIDMNSVVFGRVGGNGYTSSTGNKISLFTFELSRGNPYGIVSISIYNIIRGIAYIIMALVLFGKIVATAYNSNSGRARDAFKDGFKYSLIAFGLLTVMPYFLDVAVYLRDSVLYAVGIKGASDLLGTGQGVTVVDSFKEGASKSLLNTFMYAGSIALSVYFAVQYAGIALSMTISVVAFPFVCIKSQIDKSALSSWVNEVVGYLLIPVMDSVLLLIPSSMSLLGSSNADSNAIAVVQLFVCAMLIPSRQTLRSILGFRSNMGLEGASFGTMMAGAMLAKSAVGNTIGAVSNGIKDYKEGTQDINMGNMTSELGQLEQGSGGYSISDASNLGGQSNSYQNDPIAAAQNNFAQDSEVSMDTQSSSLDDKRQEILRKYATANNFENPIFNGMSSQRRAELYRERGKNKRSEAIAKTTGRVLGATTGSVVGSSFGTMLGGRAMMAGALVGMEAGGDIGRATIGGATKVGTAINGYLNKLAADDSSVVEESNSLTNEPMNAFNLNQSASLTGIQSASQTAIQTSDQIEYQSAMPVEYQQNQVYDQFKHEEMEYSTFLYTNQESIQNAIMNSLDFNSSEENTAQIEAAYQKIKNDRSIVLSSKKEAFGKEVVNIMKINYMNDIKKSSNFKKSGNMEKDNSFIARSANEGFSKHCYYESNPDSYTPSSAITDDKLEKFGWGF